MKATALCMAVAGLAFGQGRVGPIGQGFGSVVFPGTGVPGHASNLGSTIRGVYPGGGGGGVRPPGRPPGRPPQSRPPVVVPVPVYVGGYGYGYGYNGYAPQEPVTVVNEAPSVPSVIINQGYQPDRAQPAMYEYPPQQPQSSEMGMYQAPVPSHAAPEKPAPVVANNDDSPTVYLIALRDGTVYSAYAYWLEADTLHYITTKHSHNRATLSLVDEPLTLQLNRERQVEFKLKTR